VKLKWNDSCIENDSRRFTYRNYPDAGGSERDTGALQGEKSFCVDYSALQTGKVSLVHEGPYSRRLYFHSEYNFQTYENHNTKGHWLEDWKPEGVKTNHVAESFKKNYKSLSGL